MANKRAAAIHSSISFRSGRLYKSEPASVLNPSTAAGIQNATCICVTQLSIKANSGMK